MSLKAWLAVRIRECSTYFSLVVATACVASPPSPAQNVLERFPVCEPSGVAAIPCGNNEQACLLVGDNEEEMDLFRYEVLDKRRTLKPFEGNDFNVRLPEEVSDIEAITALEPREFLVFGSHGRGRDCDPKGKRRRFLRVRLDGRELVTTGGGLVRSRRISCAQIFGEASDGDPLIESVCSAIDRAEDAAEEVNERRKESKDDDQAIRECSQAGPFNLEGAAVLEGGRGQEVWTGLRSPLVPHGAGAPKAVLLRLSGLDQFQFNAATLLDLGGRGIRELSTSGNWIWGIAGPTGEEAASFALWRFPKSELKPGAVIRPEIVRVLPDSSEGLAFSGNALWVLIDGASGGKSGRCEDQPQFVSFPGVQ